MMKVKLKGVYPTRQASPEIDLEIERHSALLV